MEKKRVEKGENYYYINAFGEVAFDIDYHIGIANQNYEIGNYFRSKESAEAMVSKLYAVFAGADVIQMPSEEDASFESANLLGLSGHKI